MVSTTQASRAPETGAPGARSGVVWVALGTVYVVWGSTYLAIRVVNQSGAPPLFSAGVRFLAAGLVLGAVLGLRGGWRSLIPGRRSIAAAGLVGTLLLVGGNGGVVLGERTVPSGLAALLVAEVPLWVVVLRAAVGDRVRAATLVGVLVGFAGLAVLVLPGSHGGGSIGGILTIVAATISWASGSWGAARLPMPADAFVATMWEMLVAGVILLAVGAGELGRVEWSSVQTRGWVALGYLIVFGSLVAFTAYVWLLANAPISMVATYAYVNPVVAVVLGALILSEPITGTTLIGGAIVVLGVLLVVRSERARRMVTGAGRPRRTRR